MQIPVFFYCHAAAAEGRAGRVKVWAGPRGRLARDDIGDWRDGIMVCINSHQWKSRDLGMMRTLRG